MRSFYRFLVIFIGFFSLQRCAEPVVLSSEEESMVMQEAERASINGALDKMAYTLARSMAAPEVRVLIHRSVGKRFDGDIEVLYKDLHQERVGKQSFEEMLAMHLQNSKQLSFEKALAEVQGLAIKIPKFQIAVPVHFASWIPGKEVPLVAYAPVGIDDLALKRVKAYDSQGNVHWLDAQEAPDFPVVVLGISERTDEQGNITYIPLEMPPCSDDEPDCNNGGGSGGGGNVLPRNSGDYEYLEQLRVLDDYEPWWKGSPELWFEIRTAANPSGGLTYGAYIEDSNIANAWRYLNLRTFAWYREPENDMGTVAVWFWVEKDGGAQVTTSVNVNLVRWGMPMTTTLNFTYNDDDDVYGYQSINAEETLRQYGFPHLQWKVIWRGY